MKKVLDCESLDSIYRSLEDIMGLSRADIESAFAAFDIDEFLSRNPGNEEAPEDVMYSVVRRLAKDTAFDQTCWFHLTRTDNAEKFRKGILPLDASLDGIWAFLENLARHNLAEQDLNRFLSRSVEGHAGYLYNLKTQKKHLCGPYAMLVRDVAFHANEIGNHDYLDVPEIVEDICRGLAEWHDFDLLAAYKANTRPCIVKFVSSAVSENYLWESYLCAVVNYLYRNQKGMRYSGDCNRCFEGRGEAISAEQILRVELL